MDEGHVDRVSPDMDADFSVRSCMKKYWEDHSKDGSLQEMMLDSDAEELNKYELPEILSYAPDFKGKEVVELGAGIGRFTTVIAPKAKRLVVVDFVKSFVMKNIETNQKYKNIDFRCADVMTLDLKFNSYDIVFSNWLFMYLADKELIQLLTNILSWLREGGFMFCRESCLHPSGDAARTTNPTQYRDPDDYNALFRAVNISTEDETGFYRFQTVLCTTVTTYKKVKQNGNQLIWSLRKIRVPE